MSSNICDFITIYDVGWYDCWYVYSNRIYVNIHRISQGMKLELIRYEWFINAIGLCV
jgi:hypothetical protein